MDPIEDGFVTVRLPNGLSYALSVAVGQDGYHAAVASEGAYDENWHFLNAWLRPGEVMFDLGANIGTISIPAAVSGLTVHSFELLDANVQHLVKSVRKNGLESVFITIGAVSDRNDFVGISGVSAWATVVTDALVSLPTVVIDNYVRMKEVERVDVIKIDIEGSELQALRGSILTIERDRPDILIECNAATCGNQNYSYRELLSLLSERSYDIYRLYHRQLCPWTPDTVQEVIFSDYFATCKTPAQVTERCGWPIYTMSHDDIIESIVNEDNHGDLHKQFIFAIQSSLPLAVVADERVSRLLAKWMTLYEPRVNAILVRGAE